MSRLKFLLFYELLNVQQFAHLTLIVQSFPLFIPQTFETVISDRTEDESNVFPIETYDSTLIEWKRWNVENIAQFSLSNILNLNQR